jgi:A/G-specific adenine glycosylase
MTKKGWEAEKIERVRERLLAWYDRCRRDLPWRRSHDPYAIWVSEIMLQQTRVEVVVERYQAFMARFPTLISLALAPEQDVLATWSGLGYYRRARMLHKAAQFVADHCQGNLPQNAGKLRLLPGIGAYTAAAVASIAHGEPVAVVDGNVERVFCRLEGWKAGSRSGGSGLLRRKCEELAAKLVDPNRPGDFNQALMELGATLCLPRNPQCKLCPIEAECRTQGEHQTAPRPQMQSREVAYALSIRSGRLAGQSQREVLLVQRPDAQTVMPGMWELPMLRDTVVPEKELCLTLRHAIMQVNYHVRIRTVSENDVEAMIVSGAVPGEERHWVPLGEVSEMALTGLARKVLTRLHLLSAAPLEFMTPQADNEL